MSKTDPKVKTALMMMGRGCRLYTRNGKGWLVYTGDYGDPDVSPSTLKALMDMGLLRRSYRVSGGIVTYKLSASGEDTVRSWQT